METCSSGVITNATAPLMPSDVSIFFDTPKNGQMPRNCDRMTLFTKMALIKINIYSIAFYFFILFTIAVR